MVDAEKLEVGSILFWQDYDTYWRIEGVDTEYRTISVWYIHMSDQRYSRRYNDLSFDDGLFKGAILFACPKHAFMLDR